MSTITRRTLLIGGAAVLASASLPAIAREHLLDQARDPALDAFMSLSNALVNHHLRADVGALIVSHAQQAFPAFEEHAKIILDASQAKPGAPVEDFFDDIPAGGAKDLAYWIIAAWYSGMSGATNDSTLFTFEHALTFQVTQDMVPIPSYGFTGPNRWDDLVSAPLNPIPTF